MHQPAPTLIFAQAVPMPPRAPLPAVVTMTCYRCHGEGELVDYRGPVSIATGCPVCATGRVTYHLALIDGDVIGYCEETGELLALSADGLLEGLEAHGPGSALARWAPDVTRSGRDRYLMGEVSR
jgi:hypothetical protein